MTAAATTTTTRSPEQQGGKLEDCTKMADSISSPSNTCFKDEPLKSGDENKMDDGDENVTPYVSKNNHNNDSSVVKSQDEKLLVSTKAEMGEVMEENQRLKQHLNKIMKDYQILQNKFNEISQQHPKPTPIDDHNEEEELVSLSLGRSLSLDSNKNNIKLSKITTNASSSNQLALDDHDEDAKERRLDLGLEYKGINGLSMGDCTQTLIPSSSPENSLDEIKDGEETWAPSKVSNKDDNDVVQQPPMKKARVSVRVRCDTPTMNDGCQWRKYGQKIAKGNPCPRAYYRCTVAPSCPVRKQVQRCAEDMSILITTYEGTHNHPLPVSATAMASTTSAAAYMLMSKSSSSSNPLGSNPSTSTLSKPTEHEGFKFNFNFPDNSKQNPIYLPNSSTFCPNPTNPTVTLDLTSTSLPSTNQQNIGQNYGSRYYSSTNLAFNFSDHDNSSNYNNTHLVSWPNLPKTQINPLIIGSSTQINSHQNPYNNQINMFQNRLNHNHNHNPSINHDSLPDSITQAAKVLTSDPNFHSILKATLSSFISGNNGNVGNNVINSSTTTFSDTMIKWNGLHTSSSSNPSTSKETNERGQGKSRSGSA